MIGSLPSRRLRLERLESRCLLAAEFLAFANGFDGAAEKFHDEVRGFHVSDRDYSVDFRHDNAASVVEDRNSELQFVFSQRGRDNTPRATDEFFEEFRVAKSSQTAPVLFATSVDRVVFVLSFPPYRTPSGNAYALVSATSPNETMAQVLRSLSANDAVEDASSAKTLSNKIVASATLAPSVVDEVLATAASSGLQASTRATQSTLSLRPQQTVDSADPIEVTSQSSRPLLLDRTSYDFETPTPNQRSETIDFFPLQRDNSLMDSANGIEVNETDSWKMDGGTLRRLRELTERPDAGSSSTSDAVIAGWFGDRAGFIDLQSDGVPLIVDSAFDPTVSIVLDATLGLHRSLDLAAGVESESIGGTIRDRILAAITDDMSAYALSEPTLSETRISGLTYPGAVLAATALVLVNRQRKNGRSENGNTSTPSRHIGPYK